MRKLTIGDRFNYSFYDWQIIKRHFDYVLLKGHSLGQPTLWVTAKIFVEDNREQCRPWFQVEDGNSKVYSEAEMTKYYAEQCLLLDRAESLEMKKIEELAKTAERERVRIDKIHTAQALKDKAESTLKEIFSNGKTAQQLGKSSKVRELIAESQVYDRIIQTLKR